MKKITRLLVCLPLILVACNGTPEEVEAFEPASEAKLIANESSDHPYGPENAKLIKSADFRFEVRDMRKAVESIELSTAKYPAYISSSSLNQRGTMLENKLTLRVQNEYFDQLLKELDQLVVQVSYRNVQTTDVSKNFVDLESRLKTKREVEQRYMEILRKKTGTIKEVLDAESQIAALHEEIEATVSKLNYLKSQVSYSTINLEMYQVVSEQVIARDDNNTGTRFSKAFSAGLNGLINFFVGMAYIWPILFLTGIGLVVLKYKRKTLWTATKVKM